MSRQFADINSSDSSDDECIPDIIPVIPEPERRAPTPQMLDPMTRENVCVSPTMSAGSLMSPTGMGPRAASSAFLLGGAANVASRKGFLSGARKGQLAILPDGGQIARQASFPSYPPSSPGPSSALQGECGPTPQNAPADPPQPIPTPTIPMCSLLVLGGPQCGKSSFVNACRQANITSDRWTEAPVGRCGLYGTMNAIGYPNTPREASWQLIDTPGRMYSELASDESDDSLLLAALFSGISLPTQLLGRGATTIADLSSQPACKENTPYHAIVLVSAADLVEDSGPLTWLLSAGSKQRHHKAPHADATVAYLCTLVQRVREHLNNEPPLVLVTFMDQIGGAGNSSARAAVSNALAGCVPGNYIFFAGFAPDNARQQNNSALKMSLDVGTHAEMNRIFTAFRSKFNWGLQNTLYRVRKMIETRRPTPPQRAVTEVTQTQQLPAQPRQQRQITQQPLAGMLRR